MKYVMLAAALALAGCQPRATRLLLLDLALADPAVLEGTAAPWHTAGYTVEYRRFYPHLTRQDLARYQTVVLLGGREPEAPSDALTLGDLAILTEWAHRGGVVVLGYAGDGEGFGDRWVLNRWLASLGTGLVIGDYPLQDTVPPPGGAVEPQPRAVPLPTSSLDNAGFEPFPAGRNHVVVVRSPTQALARTSPDAFIRPPREAPAPRGGAAVVAASRVDDGLVIVTSRHALAATGIDLRPATLPFATPPDIAARTHVFLEALARWTRRPAEWAAVAPATRRGPLLLTGAPHPVGTHPPPLAPPPGAAVTLLAGAGPVEPRMSVPGWIARQGMRGLWSRPTLRELDSVLPLLDAGAFNTLVTVVPAWALADTLGPGGGTRGGWRVAAERLQATSLHWFPAVGLIDLRVSLPKPTRPAAEAPPRPQPEIDVRGDTVALPVWCALDELLWRGALRPTFRALVRMVTGRREVVAGIALDLELPKNGYAGAGFCDADYRAGLGAVVTDSAERERLAALAPEVRYVTLLEGGRLGAYYEALERLVAERAAALRVELRALSPDLRFAFRSVTAPEDWFSLGLLRGFSTSEAPVLLWTRERRVRALLGRYRARGIFALSALGLEPERLAPGDWARPVRRLAFGEHDGFWLGTLKSDSLGRQIRRFAK